jgi:hypothetical protein
MLQPFQRFTGAVEKLLKQFHKDNPASQTPRLIEVLMRGGRVVLSLTGASLLVAQSRI